MQVLRVRPAPSYTPKGTSGARATQRTCISPWEAALMGRTRLGTYGAFRRAPETGDQNPGRGRTRTLKTPSNVRNVAFSWGNAARTRGSTLPAPCRELWVGLGAPRPEIATRRRVGRGARKGAATPGRAHARPRSIFPRGFPHAASARGTRTPLSKAAARARPRVF